MKNVLLGFLMTTCMFLMIGATNEEPNAEERQIVVECEASENGRYQGYFDGVRHYMIDARTGVLYYVKALGKNKKKWVRFSPETDWIVE
ncbi:MAG: hypothetical protein CMG11_04455 [Candidatus Marinimicrobia bacterium]|nr:hypothetical protein [Candidatus Neomarinimicrobiota bacterium]